MRDFVALNPAMLRFRHGLIEQDASTCRHPKSIELGFRQCGCQMLADVGNCSTGQERKSVGQLLKQGRVRAFVVSEIYFEKLTDVREFDGRIGISEISQDAFDLRIYFA